MNTKNILILSAASVLLSSANAAYVFTEDFEGYTATSGTALNTLGTSWTAANSYELLDDQYSADGFDLYTGNIGNDQILSNTSFAAQSGNVYLGFDVDFDPGASNFFLFSLSNGVSDASSAAAIFGSSGGTPIVTARAFNNVGGYNAGTTTTYGDADQWNTPVRLVIAVTKSGDNGANYDTVTISNSVGTVYSTAIGDLGVSELDTIYARLGGSGGGRARLDNISVATSFGEAATIPEPSTFALLAGLCGLASIAIRRRGR